MQKEFSKGQGVIAKRISRFEDKCYPLSLILVFPTGLIKNWKRNMLRKMCLL